MPKNWIRQAAALPIWYERIGLVNTRSGKGWILPKGTIEYGQTPAETAQRESWEEAGLIGRVDPVPLGSYLHVKNGLVHHITVFRQHVERLAATWPEMHIRKRRWGHWNEAITWVHQPGLQTLLAGMRNPALVGSELANIGLRELEVGEG